MYPPHIYRGMSDLELEAWIKEDTLPAYKNFTSGLSDAVRLGSEHLLKGNLILLRVAYDWNIFRQTLPGRESWYESVFSSHLSVMEYDIIER